MTSLQNRQELAHLAVQNTIEEALGLGIPELEADAGFFSSLNYFARLNQRIDISKAKRTIAENCSAIAKSRTEAITAAIQARERLASESDRLEAEREKERQRRHKEEIAIQKEEEALIEMKLKNRIRALEVENLEADLKNKARAIKNRAEEAESE